MILPTILESTFPEIRKKILLLAPVAKHIQIDVIDGQIVQGQTFLDIEELNTIDADVKYELDLAVLKPQKYLDKKVENVFRVIAHIESGEANIAEFIFKAKKLGYEIGLALSPQTPLNSIERFCNTIDIVQFMTVNPGAQGRSFQEPVLTKIREFRRRFPKIPVQVDGGINNDTLAQVIEAGATSASIGSAIFTSEDPQKTYLKYETFLSNNLTPQKTVKSAKIQSVGFLGGAAWNPEDKAYKDAFETAKLLAQHGFRIVNGGGPGVMRAATKGAHAGGGRVLAVTYHPNKPKMHYEGVDPENDFDEEVKTLDYFDRTKVMLQTTDAHIVFNGSIGTLSELGMTWISSWIHEPDDKPIVLFGEFWHNYIQYVKANMYLKHGEQRLLKICTSPQEVLEFFDNLIYTIYDAPNS